MTSARTSALLVAGLALAVVGFTGCATASGPYAAAFPPDLPADPEPCTNYCRVWVPEVTRDVPYLVQTKTPGADYEPECVLETRYREVCVDPGSQTWKQTEEMRRCDKSIIQTKPGGYLWRKDGDCWSYCYEPPCFQECNKVVTEDGIRYCAETPPEYRVEAQLVPTERQRLVYSPGEYEVKYRKEVYQPGHWEWQATRSCTDCDCPGTCPTVPTPATPCCGPAIAPGTPRCN